MGVRGLSSFFDQNNEISQRHKLQNIRIVIDGYNLIHQRYFSSNLSLVYGGEYEKFARNLRAFFNNFRQCNVYPIVVLDGGADPTDRKLPVLLDRMKARIQTAHKISKLGETKDKLLPYLCSTVFIEILKDEGIPVLQSDFEADEEIVAIANYYQCPILSNDSDFYLFDLSGGFIRLDSLHDNVCYDEGDPRPYLPCSIYFVDSFLTHFPGIRKDVLPLFGTLMGNDYIRPETFDNFFGNIRLPKSRCKKLRISPRHAKMVGLLSWLENKTYDEVLEHVVRSLKQENREFVLEITREVAENYSRVNSVLLGYLINPERDEPGMDNPKVLTKKSNKPPAWLLRKIHNTELSSGMLDILCNRRVSLSPMINEPKSTSCHMCSSKLRLAVYKLVLSIDGFTNCTIKEYDQKDWNLCATTVEVAYDAPLNERIPNLIVLPNVNYELRRFYLLNSLQTQDLDLSALPPTLQLPIAVLNYFTKHSGLSYSPHFISALICCIIILGIVRPFKYRNTVNLRGVTRKEVNIADAGFSKFFNKPRHNNARIFLVDIVHRFSEYQASFRVAYNLNQLLNEPLTRPLVSDCLSGTFVYNLTAILQTRSSPDLFVSEHMGRGSRLDEFYYFLKNNYVTSTPTVDESRFNKPQQMSRDRRGPPSHQRSGARVFYPSGNRFEVLNS